MAANLLTSYGELARILYRLPTLVADARRARGLSQEAAAAQIGVSKNAVQRLEAGGNDGSHGDTIIRVLNWLDET